MPPSTDKVANGGTTSCEPFSEENVDSLTNGNDNEKRVMHPSLLKQESTSSEVATPIISNRVEKTAPTVPPFELPQAATSSGSRGGNPSSSSRHAQAFLMPPQNNSSSKNSSSSHRPPAPRPFPRTTTALAPSVVRMPRFSSPTETPIVAKQSTRRRISHQGPSTTMNRGETFVVGSRKRRLDAPLPGLSFSFLNGMDHREPATVSLAVSSVLALTPLAVQLMESSVRRFVHSVMEWQQHLRGSTTSALQQQQQHSSGIRTNTTSSYQRPQLQSSARTTTTTMGRHPTLSIRGLVNYGQTCFLNSVLQALASLDPYCAYLERLVELEQQSDDNDGEQSTSACLVQLLHQINGLEDRALNKMDPRTILQAVGRKHVQFRPKYAGAIGKEQQDAQEFLQALQGIIVQENPHSLVPPSLPSRFLELQNDNDDEDEVLTVLSEHRKQHGNALLLANPTPLSVVVPTDASSLPTGLAVSTLSLEEESTCTQDKPTTLGHQNGEGRVEKESEVEEKTSNGHANGKSHVEASNGHSNGSSSAEPHLSRESNDQREEEKKLEEFEVHLPRVASEDIIFGDATALPVQSVLEKRISNQSEAECMSDLSSSTEHNKRVTGAMQIMMSTVSSITPSPLCGWMGSALQCRTCQHVRAIQCTPFYDIPVVPTSVSDYLGGAAIARGDPPQKSVAPQTRPCTLEECLEEFTRVERVEDVECRCCTMQAEIKDLEEEVGMLRGAIEGLLAKAKRTHPDDNDKPVVVNVKDLRDELQGVELRLGALQSASPDDDEDALNSLLRPLNHTGVTFDDDEVEKAITLKRHDASKCLRLTRLPSILSIHVQRRYYDPVANRMTKTVQHVVFPEFLNAAPYCAFGVDGIAKESFPPATPSAASAASVSSRRPIPYRLEAVIEHRGGAFQGHYICYRRVREAWYYVSDDVVKEVSWQKVQQCQAYMLFYEAI